MICDECQTVVHCTKNGCIPKQPAQEPVAFFDPQSKGFYWAKPTKVIPPVTVDVEPLPLYTSPPAQRTWKGLTYKEVQEIHDTYHKRMGPQEFSKAIEAKLRSKNT